MSRKLQFRALMGLVVVITIIVGVLVWPVPKEAKATHSSLFIHLETPGLNENWYDIDAKIHMLDYLGTPIPDGWIVDLIPDPGNGQVWEVTLYNIPDVAVNFKLTWDASPTRNFDWDDEDGEKTGLINWQNAELNFNEPCEYQGE